ncbi:hypothetical protein Aduo_009259 [Ancylostoma duodenale]
MVVANCCFGFREDVDGWRVLEGQVRRQDEEDFIAEMAERHDCVRLLAAARSHVKCLQNLVQHLR